MKKTLIILGVILILLLGAIWIYLFTYGAPESSDDVFARFNGDGDIVDVSTPNNQNIEVDQIDATKPARFRKITNRPVAGAVFTEDSVRFVEQGTGHIYEIDLNTLRETLISGTTIPQTSHATFTATSTNVAITSFTANGTETIVGDIYDSELHGVALPPNATEIEFTDDGTLYYLLKNTSGASGYMYDMDTQKSTVVFAVPLRDIDVLWGNPHYIYTTPTAIQKGYVYKIGKNNTLSYVTAGGNGLVAVRYGAGIITTLRNTDGFEFTAITDAGGTVPQALPYIPEKCTQNPLSGAVMYCAVPTNLSDGEFPDDWYMGMVAYTDTLWSMNVETGQALSLIDLSMEAGQSIDVAHIGTDTYGTKVFIINKNDNSLWVFDRSVE